MNDVPARRISSGLTGFYKNVFPFLLCGSIALIGVIALMTVRINGRLPSLPLLFLLPPVLAGSFVYIVVRKLTADFVDEVYDCGDHLEVWRGGREASVPLANIVNVNYSIMVNPRRIMLTLREPCFFGATVTFMPLRARADFWNLGMTNQFAEDLIRRVDTARRQA